MRYIRFPIETEPRILIRDVHAALQARFPGWTPNDGNLDTWLIESQAAQAADLRFLATAVPDIIFRYFGVSLMDIPPEDAAPAITTTTWTAIDNKGYAVEAGTQVGIRNPAGELIPFVTLNEVTIPPGATVTAVGAVSIIALTAGSDGSGLGSVGGPVELIDPLDWVLSVTMTQITTGGVDAELDDDYLNRLRTKLTTMSPRPILPRDFAILARDVEGVHRAVALDGYNPFHNLLNANQSSIETDVTGWEADTNVNVSQTGAQAAAGIKSLQMSSVAAGDMIARVLPATSVPVIPGDTITALASFRAAANARATRVRIDWLKADQSLISSSTASGADVTTGFTSVFVTAQAPALAAYARIKVIVVGTGAAAEIHYVDKISVRRGATTDWVVGGTAETGAERTVTVAAQDATGAPAGPSVKAAVAAHLDAMREVNFVINVIDPTITNFDIAYQVKAVVGADHAQVVSRVDAALQAYLDPLTWGVPIDGDDTDWVNQPAIRYLELATVINNTLGVDYIVALSFGIAGFPLGSGDVTLPGVAALPDVGSLAGSAV